MSDQSAREKILVPRYVQYVVLPLLVILLIWFISAVKSIIILFLLAAVIAFVLDLPVSFLQDRLHIPRFIAVIVVWLIILGVFGGVLALFVIPNVINELNNLINQLPDYASNVQSIVERIQEWFREVNFPFKPDITAQDVASQLQSVGTNLANRGLDLATAVLSLGFNALLMFVISIYMLADARRIKQAVKNRFPERFRGDAVKLFGHMQTAVGNWFKGQLIISSLMGVFGGIIAYWGSGGYSFLIGFWVALVEVIPFIGPFLGMIPAIILAWLAGGPIKALIVAVLFIGVEQLEGQILVPKIMGRTVGVHPLWVLFAVLAGSTFGGIAVGLMAVPILAVITAAIRFFREEVELEKWERPLLEKKAVEEAD